MQGKYGISKGETELKIQKAQNEKAQLSQASDAETSTSYPYQVSRYGGWWISRVHGSSSLWLFTGTPKIKLERQKSEAKTTCVCECVWVSLSLSLSLDV